MIHCIVSQSKKLLVILNVPDDVRFIILKNKSRSFDAKLNNDIPFFRSSMVTCQS